MRLGGLIIRIWHRSILLGLVISFLYGCLPASSVTPTPSPRSLPSETPRSPTDSPVSKTELIAASATPLMVPDTQTTKQATLPVGQLVTQEPDPLHFSFPTPGPAPDSAWRPALYPTPWAQTPYDHFYFARPIAADEINWPLANYRYGGVFFEDIVHSGVDIPASPGTPVLAAASGKITWAGYGLYYGYYDTSDPYGLAILIRHDFGYKGEILYTVYGHLNRIDVVKGQHVESGDQIGLSGQTGKVTGPHLHFEVRLGKGGFFSTRNPELWLVPPQGWGVVAGRVMNTGGLFLESQLVKLRSQSSGQTWSAYTYGAGPVHSDPYYQENMVISDMPAGRYFVEINYLSKNYTLDLLVKPGLVNTFSFRGRSGFVSEPPAAPTDNFISPSP